MNRHCLEEKNPNQTKQKSFPSSCHKLLQCQLWKAASVAQLGRIWWTRQKGEGSCPGHSWGQRKVRGTAPGQLKIEKVSCGGGQWHAAAAQSKMQSALNVPGGKTSPSYWWSVCQGCVALASGTKEIYLTLLGETLKLSEALTDFISHRKCSTQ